MKWGLDGLFNIDLPSPSSNKWLFLADRKVWKKELETQGGSPLKAAKDIIAKPGIPSKWTFAPHMLLTMVQTTSRYLCAPHHRQLFDKVSKFFLIYHKVHLPYRIPVKIPCITPKEKMHISRMISNVIDRQMAWPPLLRNYIASRIQVISSKSKQVGSYLLSQGLSEMNSYVTEPPSLCLDDCSCLAYSNIPGTSIVEGHLVFRDPACLTPMSPSLDVEVYSQNLKNATMPSWKSFKNQFMEGLKPLKNALPSNRNLAAIDIISEVVGVCANFYRTKCMTYPKKVYGPYLQRNASLLPSFLYVGFLDKAPQIPIFGCLEFWKGAHHNNFFCVPRYKELHRMVTHHDAKTLMLWQISDSASLSFTGEYSRFSMLAGWTPLTNEEVAKATRIHSMFPASVVTRNLLKGLLGTMVKKLSLALPQGIHDIHIGGMHLQPLLPMPTRKRIAKRTTVLSEDPSEHPVRAGPDIGGEGPPQPDDRRSRTPRTPRPRPNSRRGRPPSRPPPPTPPETSMRDLRNHYHPKTYTPGKHTYRCARSAKGRVSDPMCH